MKNLNLVFLFAFTLILGCSTATKKADLPKSTSLNGQWPSEVLESADGVVLIPQWHLSPQTNTKNMKTEPPQSKNQTAIYKEVSDWVKSDYLQSVVIEGCEVNLKQTPTTKYNGWSLEDLLKQDRSSPEFEAIQTHVGLKLIAAFESKSLVECGDRLSLIKDNQLALSDIRGLSGFKLRIEQSSLSAADRDRFIEGLRAVLKLPPDTNYKLTIQKLDSELVLAIRRFEELIVQRNESLLDHAKKLKGRKAIIVGSLHIANLKQRLQDQKIPFSVWEPTGLTDTEVDLITQLKQKLSLSK